MSDIEPGSCKNDHDALVTLIANVSNLKEGQDNFHREMKESFRDLKENYTARLNDHETRLNALETSRTRQNTAMGIGIAILSILVSIMSYHIAR